MKKPSAELETHVGPLVAKPTKYRWIVALLFFVIYTIAAADRANLGVALPFLRKQFAMSNAEAGALLSLFLIAYAVVQLPSAWLVSRFGVRKIFSVSMILTSIATGLTGIVGSLLSLKLCRIGLGLVEGPLPISITTTINNWFPSREKGTASGLFLSSVKFGPVITPILGATIIAAWGWKAVFLCFAVPGIALSLLWYCMVTDRPSQTRSVNRAELELIAEKDNVNAPVDGGNTVRAIPWLDKLIRARHENVLESTDSIFKSWNIYGCALGYCCQLGISSVLLAWIPTYLMTVKKFSILSMGVVAAVPWIGAVVGNILGGIVSDRLLGKRRKPCMMLSALATALMMFAMIHSPADPVLYGALMFLTGMLLSIGFSAYMVYPMPLVAKKKFPVASAIVNMGGQLGGAATPFITGLLLDQHGWGAVFAFMGGISLLTFLILLTISEPMNTRTS
ncbi:MFS transporter [Burkholderia stagnalis]|uniref:MFS transporter n=1 Tax=Burkholderia stagnalis TaxID=1503054 RepID=UPI0007600A80|nr:MFS transporter [Burkholderia stagnalis]KWK44919.1 MFS transporter [Burkholderia stagnalis]KWK57351.1 MFS transporter [Burkholderia stagnalis]